MKCICAGRYGWRRILPRNRPTGPSCGIGYDTGLMAWNQNLPRASEYITPRPSTDRPPASPFPCPCPFPLAYCTS
ncbi:hypothetical protein I7I50_01294 [Histoplasma capsulatum G186AR]|uniref:Uncharacterized protein n=1 Tax=Ajellomyces capsulatus TaxID=5037 RepID=A0A8H7YZ44_AJECA|nr:hypothetical protein I7I52_08879 [Histoplasma capsulatum]QSS73210.1 hypothetical protein I7I50_01294 [Histoplasma capsulatum G186AR]